MRQKDIKLKMRLARADLITKLPAQSKIFPLSIKNLKIKGNLR
jgi:hypothetical protein